jgi:hypothetical protein
VLRHQPKPRGLAVLFDKSGWWKEIVEDLE